MPRDGHSLLPPDSNEANDNFTVVPGGIRFGLAAIKNIGRGFIQKVMNEREQGGKFTSLEDFASRMYGTDLNKRALENLIKAGACDGFGLNRAQMLRIYELVLDAAASQKNKNVDGQMGLFDLLSGEDSAAAMPAVQAPDIPEMSVQEKMSLEKQTTGLYLSGHPMDEYRPLLRGMDVVPIGEILECFENGGDTYQDEQIVNIAGIVEAVKMKTTRSGSMMAYVTVEDDTDSLELLTFSIDPGQCGSLLYENSPVILNGRISVLRRKTAADGREPRGADRGYEGSGCRAGRASDSRRRRIPSISKSKAPRSGRQRRSCPFSRCSREKRGP